MHRRILCGVVMTLISGAALAQSAAPQGDSKPAAVKASGGLEEITVTANRREQNLQDVGTSIAAFTGEQLQELGVVSAADVTAITPNVDLVRSYSGPGFNTQITIRGVGQPDFSDTTEATATSYVDEFYMIGAGQADFLTFDLARVEVARGPQGTLQGRNSTAGSINYYSNPPELNRYAGQASVTAGENRLTRSNAFLNFPIGDIVAVRASVATDYNQGYLKNINPQALFSKGGNSNFVATRLQVLIKPSDTFQLKIKGEYGESGPIASNEKGIETGTIPGKVGTYQVPTDAFGQNMANVGAGATDVVNTVGPNEQNANIRHVLARADWTPADRWSVVGLAGWLKSRKNEVETCDHTPIPICLFSNIGESKHTVVELRSLYNATNWRLTTGANYLKQDIDARSATPLFFSPQATAVIFGPTATGMYTQTFHDQQSLKSWAVFSQGEYDLDEQWTLMAGVRYTHDKKEFNGFDAVSLNIPLSTPIPRNIDQFSTIGALAAADPAASLTTINSAANGDLATISKGLVNGLLQLNYKPTGDMLVYGSVRRGVKGGGFISGNAAGTPANLRKYKDEVNLAYEVGVKSTILNSRARLNAAVFYYDYKRMQNTSFIGITNVITNNDAKLYGGEVELTSSLTDQLQLSAGVGLLHTKVYNINNPTGAVPAVEDNELPLAPKVSGNLQARYTWDVGPSQFWLQGSGKYKSSFWRDSLNNPSTHIPGSAQVDALAGYGPADGHWSLSLWVNNVFDSRKPINLFDLSTVGGTGEVVYQMPRWVGATFTTKF
jgi:iron complex outermembrane receptor protein